MFTPVLPMLIRHLCVALLFSHCYASAEDLTEENFLERYLVESSRLSSEYSDCIAVVDCSRTDPNAPERIFGHKFFARNGSFRLDIRETADNGKTAVSYTHLRAPRDRG